MAGQTDGKPITGTRSDTMVSWLMRSSGGMWSHNYQIMQFPLPKQRSLIINTSKNWNGG